MVFATNLLLVTHYRVLVCKNVNNRIPTPIRVSLLSLVRETECRQNRLSGKVWYFPVLTILYSYCTPGLKSGTQYCLYFIVHLTTYIHTFSNYCRRDHGTEIRDDYLWYVYVFVQAFDVFLSFWIPIRYTFTREDGFKSFERDLTAANADGQWALHTWSA